MPTTSSSKVTSVTKPRKLTLKQRRFVSEYLETGNASKAARRVYNANSLSTEGTIAYENMQKPAIIRAIAMKLTQEDITDRLIIEELAKKINSENEATQLKALELLGKYRKLFTDKVDHTHVLEHVKSIGWGEFDELAEANEPRKIEPEPEDMPKI